MKFTKQTSILAGVALLAVGAMLGGFYAAETGQQPFSYSHVTASAAEAPQNVIELQNSLKAVVKSVQPAVVSVMSTQQVRTSTNGRGGV